MKRLFLVVALSLPMFGQQAAIAVGLRSGPTDPAQCSDRVLNIFKNTTDDTLKHCVDGAWVSVGGVGVGSGDVVGPASSVNNEITLFSGTGGKTIKRASGTGFAYVTSGVLSAVSITDADVPDTITVDASTLASTVASADTTDATSFIAMFESATGNQALKTDGGLTYNASTGTLTATAFAGPLTGNVTGNVSGSSGSSTGNSATATALAANGTNCSAGNYPLGVDASGNAESCTSAGGGLPATDTTSIAEGSSDATKEVRFEVDGITTGTTRVVTVPDSDTTIPIASQVITITGPTAARTFTFPDAAAAIATTNTAQTISAVKTHSAALVAADGSAATPSLSFSSSTDLGFSRYSAAAVRWSTGGTERGVLGSNYVAVGAGAFYLGATTGNTTAGIGYIAAGVTGLVNSAGTTGAGSLRGNYIETVVGANVASATTITLTSGIQHVTGTTPIQTINLPRAGYTGCVRLIPDAIWTLTTGGNIAVASTAVVSRVMDVCYDGTSWFPSY